MGNELPAEDTLELQKFGLGFTVTQEMLEHDVYQNPQAGPKFYALPVDCDLSVGALIGAWKRTVEDVKLMPDTLIIHPAAFADWVLSISQAFRLEGYEFKVLLNDAMGQDDWCLYCGTVPGYGSRGA